MNSMKQNWQRTLAAFATMAAMQTPTVVTAYDNPPAMVTPRAGVSIAPAGTASGRTPVTDADVTTDPREKSGQYTDIVSNLENLKMAKAKLLQNYAESYPTVVTVQAKIEQLTKAKTEFEKEHPSLAQNTAATLLAAENPTTAGTRAGNFAPAGVAGSGALNRVVPDGMVGARAQHYGKLEGKLREIIIDEVKLDGLPLSEVLNFLGETSRERDPEKKGINFLIDPNQPQFVPSGSGSIDPATGLPMPVATEPIDVNSISVRFNMPLRHVTLADVLDAIVRVADRPIQYSVEDYAVIFSLRPDANVAPPMSGRAPGPAPLAVRTFHVDTNTFAGGLESAFGIKVETKGKGESQSRKVQSALKELLAQLNISLEGNKAIFYNELTGTVMVRAAVEDIDVIQAAIETLGGQAMSDYAMRSPQGVPGTRPERYGTRW